MTSVEPGDSSARDDEQSVLDEARAVLDPLEARPWVDMEALDHAHRLLLVHAHPDDETIGTGATMAKYVAEGALVTLVTCTQGEEGEILVSDLEHLAASRDGGLGLHRADELAVAMEALRVTDHRFLGGPGRWRDSGMMDTPANEAPTCFWRADFDEAVDALVRVIRDVRPQVVITYDANGGYGHPDHIQAHRVTVAAVDRAADPAGTPDAGEPWEVAKLYFSAIPKSYLEAAVEAIRESGSEAFERAGSPDELPGGVSDEEITTQIDATDQLDAKLAAMRAHATQIAVDGFFFALSNKLGQQAFGREHYVLVRGERGPGDGPNGWESDLFAGLG